MLISRPEKPKWAKRWDILSRLPEGCSSKFYQTELGLGYQATLNCLHRFKFPFEDRRGGRKKFSRPEVLAALKESETSGKSSRQIGAVFGASHEGIRLIAKELKFDKTAAAFRAGQRAHTQHLARAALRLQRRYWPLWSCEKMAERLGIGLNTLLRGLEDQGLSWPHAHEIRKRRFKKFKELWCPDCETWRPAAEFAKDRSRDTNLGHQCYCNPHRRQRVLKTRGLSPA